MEEEDLYAVLGIEGGGPDVSQLNVRTAYRTRALTWHPDKQVGKKPAEVAAAALKFEKIQKAYEVLGDEKARKAYDELWNLRKSRFKENEKPLKRQKIMRHWEWERDAKKLMKSQNKSEPARVTLQKTLKVSWNWGTYTSVGLKEILQEFGVVKNVVIFSDGYTLGGDTSITSIRVKKILQRYRLVEDLLLRENKSGRKGQALVVMTSHTAAVVAAGGSRGGSRGDSSNPLFVVPLIDDLIHDMASRSREKDILREMRRAGERARLIKQMQEADAKEMQEADAKSS